MSCFDWTGASIRSKLRSQCKTMVLVVSDFQNPDCPWEKAVQVLLSTVSSHWPELPPCLEASLYSAGPADLHKAKLRAGCCFFYCQYLKKTNLPCVFLYSRAVGIVFLWHPWRHQLQILSVGTVTTGEYILKVRWKVCFTLIILVKIELKDLKTAKKKSHPC